MKRRDTLAWSFLQSSILLLVLSIAEWRWRPENILTKQSQERVDKAWGCTLVLDTGQISFSPNIKALVELQHSLMNRHSSSRSLCW